MKLSYVAFVIAVAAFYQPTSATAADGYQVAGSSGIMHFVAVDDARKNDEDVYRAAVATICAGKPICQVHFWVGKAPKAFPLTDAQVNTKLVHWQQNLNTGLRRWLVRCDDSSLFAKERSCM